MNKKSHTKVFKLVNLSNPKYVTYNIDYVKEKVKLWNLTCVSEKFFSLDTPLKLICKKGHNFERSIVGLNKTHRCPFCFNKVDERFEECKQIAKNYGGELLSTKYVNTIENLIWKCSEGHIFNISYSRVKKTWCAKCKNKNKTINKKNIDLFRSFAKEKGGKCLSDENIGTNSNIKWRCKNGHEWYDKFSMAKKRWCQECNTSYN